VIIKSELPSFRVFIYLNFDVRSVDAGLGDGAEATP